MSGRTASREARACLAGEVGKPNPEEKPRGRRHKQRSRRVLVGVIVGVCLSTMIVTIGIESPFGKSNSGSTAESLLPLPGMQVAFRASFNGRVLNSKRWDTCYPKALTAIGCTNTGNPELEWYLPSQDRVGGGLLALTSQRGPVAGLDRRGNPKTYTCRSGMVTTHSSFSFLYGLVEVRARVPVGRNLWPAIWLAAASGKWPPEIDIEESWGVGSGDGFLDRPALHLPGGRLFVSPTTVRKGWHTYALLWEPHVLEWYVDGRAILRLTRDVPTQRMYLIMDLAARSFPISFARKARIVGPVSCNGSLDVRWVKIWQR